MEREIQSKCKHSSEGEGVMKNQRRLPEGAVIEVRP